MAEMEDPSRCEQMEEEEQAFGLGGRAGDAMLRMLGGMVRLPKKAAKKAFDKTLDAMNPEVATHLIQSNRELLLAVRSLVDYEIRMADRAIDKVQRRGERLQDAEATADAYPKADEEKPAAPPPPDPLL